jgi:hypothetical protein
MPKNEQLAINTELTPLNRLWCFWDLLIKENLIFGTSPPRPGNPWRPRGDPESRILHNTQRPHEHASKKHNFMPGFPCGSHSNMTASLGEALRLRDGSRRTSAGDAAVDIPGRPAWAPSLRSPVCSGYPPGCPAGYSPHPSTWVTPSAPLVADCCAQLSSPILFPFQLSCQTRRRRTHSVASNVAERG